MQVLVYDRSKTPIMACILSHTLKLEHQGHLYMSLRDGEGATWSLLFRAQADLLRFRTAQSFLPCMSLS